MEFATDEGRDAGVVTVGKGDPVRRISIDDGGDGSAAVTSKRGFCVQVGYVSARVCLCVPYVCVPVRACLV